ERMQVSVPTQKTIARPFSFEGTGLHTGKKCLVKVSPLSTGSGIKIFRSDLGVEIPVTPFAVTSTARGTALSGEKNAILHTVEHFLAAVQGLGITNLKIEMDGEEMPIMDGSSRSFCELLESAGTQDQGQDCAPIRVTEPIELKWGDVVARAEPAEGLHLEV